MEIWPNFFIVGTDKAGTYSLYDYLKLIPGVCMSKYKEPRYFAPFLCKKLGIFRIANKKEYLDQFEDVENSLVIGEATPLYLRDPEAAKLIHNQNPRSKIIISLRDPIERLYSWHLMNQRKELAKKKFHDALHEALQNNNECTEELFDLKSSLYSNDVKRFLELFGKNQVKIIIFEEWTKNVKQTIREILNFLQLENEIRIDFDYSAQNMYYDVKPKGIISQKIINNENLFQIARKIFPKSERRFLRKRFLVNKRGKNVGTLNVFQKLLFEIKTKKPNMDAQDRKLLFNFYKDDVKNLETILGQKLPWSNFQN